MRQTMLPAADELRRAADRRAGRGLPAGGALPLAVLLLGLAALAAISTVGCGSARRTNRLLNLGLVAAAVRGAGRTGVVGGRAAC